MFSELDIPNLRGKIALVTGRYSCGLAERNFVTAQDLINSKEGGNSGIGKQTVVVLAAKGAKIYLGARSHVKYEQALQDMKVSHPEVDLSLINFLQLDLSSALSAKSAAEDYKSSVNSPVVSRSKAGKLTCAIN